eukprot:11200190-Lingulodinium_polyedra.AAC.1
MSMRFRTVAQALHTYAVAATFRCRGSCESQVCSGRNLVFARGRRAGRASVRIADRCGGRIVA